MANYIVTRNQPFFEKIGNYNYCSLEQMGTMLTPGIAVDSETTGLSALTDKIFAVQIGTGKDSFLVDLQDYSTTIAFKEYQGITQTIDEVFPYLENRYLVFHNALFDIAFLMKAGFIPDMDRVYDTLIAARILSNGKVTVKNSFGAVMERELGIKYDKSEQKNINVTKLSNVTAIQYCFNDVDRLKELHEVLYKKIQATEAVVAYRLNCRVLVPLAYMELCGLPINEHKWAAKMEKDRLAMLKGERAVTDYIWNNLAHFRDNQLDLFSTE
jgi:ribonuclease D